MKETRVDRESSPRVKEAHWGGSTALLHPGWGEGKECQSPGPSSASVLTALLGLASGDPWERHSLWVKEVW